VSRPDDRILQDRADAPDLSDQHRRLIDWEGRYPRLVYYAAPCLRDCAGFNAAYNTASVTRRSALFSPAGIGPLPDDKVHTIAYKPGLSYGYFCSEPQQIEAGSFESLNERLSQSFKEKRFRDFRNAAREVREAVLEVTSPVWREAEGAIVDRLRQSRPQTVADGTSPDADRERATLEVLVAREIARIDLGLDLMIAQPR
jgi:hypothetical protein